MLLNHTSLYEIYPKQSTSALLLTLLGKETFVCGQNVGMLMSFMPAAEMIPFRVKLLGRSMHSSASVAVKQGMEEDISGRAARTGLLIFMATSEIFAKLFLLLFHHLNYLRTCPKISAD